MTEAQILSLGSGLATFLAEFGDCFGRLEPRRKLEVYVRGQLGELPRKSIEPMALAAGMRPRTLQEFLATDVWDEDRLREHTARLVVRDHSEPQAIGIIDESGHPKKGQETACVGRQYCGNTGKIDNCVMTVHLTYSSFDGEFRTMLDSDLYLPQSWDDDRERCRRAGIPDEVTYRPKYVIALEQLDRANAHGVRFSWITADEWYTQKPSFVKGLEDRGQRFVLEMPKNFPMWLFDPSSLPETPTKPVENLCRYSRGLMMQPWQKYYIKDTDKGPMVWEVKTAACWLPRGAGAVGPYWLIVARNALNPSELKYFVSNASAGVPLAAILHVAFGRWPVERCLQDEKSELGLSHFETRCYAALKRHLLITQVSHLFLARETQRLRGEKSGTDSPPGPCCGERAHRRPPAPKAMSNRSPQTHRRQTPVLADPQRPSAHESHENPQETTQKTRHQALATTVLSSPIARKGALSY